NGSWAEFGEKIFDSQPLVPGTNTLTFLVPNSAQPDDTFARFRFSTAGGLSYDGPAMDGEVEDYQVTIQPTVDVEVQLSAMPNPVSLDATVTYSIDLTNRGPSSATGVLVQDLLPEGVSFVSASPSQGACTNTGNAVGCALGSLAPGQTATVSIRAVAQ